MAGFPVEWILFSYSPHNQRNFAYFVDLFRMRKGPRLNGLWKRRIMVDKVSRTTSAASRKLTAAGFSWGYLLFVSQFENGSTDLSASDGVEMDLRRVDNKFRNYCVPESYHSAGWQFHKRREKWPDAILECQFLYAYTSSTADQSHLLSSSMRDKWSNVAIARWWMKNNFSSSLSWLRLRRKWICI